MRPSAAPLLRAARIAAAVLVGLGAIIALPSSAHAATATFVKESQWSSGDIVEMTLDNDGADALPSWRVEFDRPAGTTLGSYWNARLPRDRSRYVFTNMAWNGALSPGPSTSFG